MSPLRSVPAGGTRRHTHERLGIKADKMAGGHLVMLSRPYDLAEHLDVYARVSPRLRRTHTAPTHGFLVGNYRAGDR